MVKKLQKMSADKKSGPQLSGAVKESAQVRRNEFLATTNNPTDMAIIGLEGRAEVLRATVSTLDMNPSKIVPPVAVLKERQRAMEQQQALAAMGDEQGGQGAPATPGSGQALMAPGGGPGPPTTDNFQPPQGA